MEKYTHAFLQIKSLFNFIHLLNICFRGTHHATPMKLCWWLEKRGQRGVMKSLRCPGLWRAAGCKTLIIIVIGVGIVFSSFLLQKSQYIYIYRFWISEHARMVCSISGWKKKSIIPFSVTYEVNRKGEYMLLALRLGPSGAQSLGNVVAGRFIWGLTWCENMWRRAEAIAVGLPLS